MFRICKGFCAKVLRTNLESTAKAKNTVEQEAALLARASEIEHEGVRAPKCFAYWIGSSEYEPSGIVMEELDAVNLQQALNGNVEFPESFNHERFLEALQLYMEELHDHGVLHGDFWPRNVMIDRESGLPRLVDFGSAQDIRGKSGNKIDELKDRELITQFEDRFEHVLESFFTKQS